jgi:hypothetical protein
MTIAEITEADLPRIAIMVIDKITLKIGVNLIRTQIETLTIRTTETDREIDIETEGRILGTVPSHVTVIGHMMGTVTTEVRHVTNTGQGIELIRILETIGTTPEIGEHKLRLHPTLHQMEEVVKIPLTPKVKQ